MRRERVRLSLWALACSMIMFLQAATAEDAPVAEDPPQSIVEEMPVIVVTAERRGVSIFDTALHATAISSEDIAERGGQTTPDALREEAGVWVQKTAQGGGSAFIRGLTGKQVLILVDGVRFNNSTFRFGPNQYLNTIDPFIADRIEVVRGPGSALYGSDALGGVINIITKRRGEFGRAPEPGADIRLVEQLSSADGGSMSRLDVDGGAGNLSYSFGAGYKHFGDLRAGSGDSPVGLVDDGVQSPSGYQETDANVGLRWALDTNSEVSVAHIFSRQINSPRSDKLLESDYVATPEEKYCYDPQEMQLTNVEYETREFGSIESLKVNVSRNYQLEGRERRKAGWTKTRFEEDEVTTLGLSAVVALKQTARNTLVAGFEYYADDIGSLRYEVADTGAVTNMNGRFPEGTEYTSGGVYLRDSIAVADGVDVALGIRQSSFSINTDFQGLTVTGTSFTAGPLDEVSETYADTTWSFELLYEIAYGLKAMLNVSRGFRAPNVDDLAVDGEWSSGNDVPNPDLEPEHAIDYELGIKWSSPSSGGTFTAFHAAYDNLIQRTYVDIGADGIADTGDELYQFQNVSEAEIQGAELSWHVRLNDSRSGQVSLKGNAMWTYGQNTTDNEPLTRIPPLNGIVGIRWDGSARGAWSELFVQAAAEQDRLSPGDESDVRIPDGGTPGWTTVNLRGGVKLAERCNLTLGLYNLGDVRYRLHGSGLDAPGFNAVARIECTF